MFRLLTSLPPGMVRFTIIDPIGIGRNFGAFMHLADFDPALVTNQVWTDPRQIEERLADLAAPHGDRDAEVPAQRVRHDRGIQRRGRRGRRALPRAGRRRFSRPRFDEKAAGRLAAIAAGGVPCGVLTLVAADPSKTMPLGFSA